jgi:hypothetical protein
VGLRAYYVEAPVHPGGRPRVACLDDATDTEEAAITRAKRLAEGRSSLEQP